jgi:gliding motility-associated-like protein
MLQNLLKIWFIWMICLIPMAGKATHNRAGEITYRQTGPLTIEITIITYTKASSTAADRDSLEVFWGDGSKEFVKRDESKTRFEANDIKINQYIASHTYPGVATYTVSFLDPNRVGGILNVNYPNSIDIPFFLSTTFTLLDQQFQGFNNSAILLQPPIDIGCVNKLFIHNPNAFDVDGDSLAYELAAPLQAVNTPVPLYRYPDQIGVSSGNTFTINPVTGEVRWNAPKLQGEYNIAIRVKEYRNGKLINIILRDMQILIKACENEPPVIKSKEEICIIAGEKLILDIDISDPNTNQKVKLSATGGPFAIKNPARLQGPAFFTTVPFKAKIEWQTTCNHISDQYYQIVLRAVDNFNPDSTGLATLRTIRIKVIGPPPENLESASENGSIKLTWDAPYACEVTENQFFQGFSVWRRITSPNYEPDTCNPGLTVSPYQRIVFKTLARDGGKYTYTDNEVESGNTYCYRVQAEFASLTASGNPYNRVESLPSNESCLILLRDLPLITKVSVEETSSNSGKVAVRWTLPLEAQLDTILNPEPYTYELWRLEPNSNAVKIREWNTLYFNTALDTNHTDIGLNTRGIQYSYFMRFFTRNGIQGSSPEASSVFLTVKPSDKQNQLSWRSETPWSNRNYRIFREADPGNFVLIGSTRDTFFMDVNLENEIEYCYRIESEGSYGIPLIEDPIFNFSQIVCMRPRDNVAPCAPPLEVKNICDRLNSNSINPEELYNTLTWKSPVLSCPERSDDLAGYHIYYAETTDELLQKIAFVSLTNGNTYLHYPERGLLGCYAITSVDTLMNESELSAKVCVDNCPFYELPNTFTPNNDGFNDVFEPRVNLFIDAIALKVFNQWGNLVYETSDPSIQWDGTTQNGVKLADGTYFYTCRVFERRVTGTTESGNQLHGFIQIIRN